jgi:flagellar motor switch/type III secretory pathway protein FliN
MPDLAGAHDARMPDPASAMARSAMLACVRAELRAEHARLTEQQIDLIADVAVELRMTYGRLGMPLRSLGRLDATNDETPRGMFDV